METNEFLETWEKGNKELFTNQKISREMIEKYLKPRVRKASRYFVFNIIFYILLQMVCIALLIVNAFGYRTNPVMLSVIFPMMFLSAGFLTYGYFLYVRWKEINNLSHDLTDLIPRKLSFLSTHYEVWMLIISISALFLIFSVNTLVDNQNGIYRINHVGLYAGVNAFLFLFIYGMQKLTSNISTGYLKAFLKDLRNDILKESVKVEQKRKKYHWVFVALAIIFLITFILVLLKARGFI